MTNRRRFIADALMTLSISLLPKILRAEIPEVKEEGIWISGSDYMVGVDPYAVDDNTIGIFMIKKRRGGITYMIEKGREKEFKSYQEWVAHYYNHFPKQRT